MGWARPRRRPAARPLKARRTSRWSSRTSPRFGRIDQAAKPTVMQRQQALLAERYDLGNRPAPGVMMSGGRKAVQQGVRVKLPAGLTWERLAAMSPDEIREKDLFPQGFLPLPHVKHVTDGMVFPTFEITEINKQEARSLERFDVDFDLPDHLLPEFPPPSS